VTPTDPRYQHEQLTWDITPSPDVQARQDAGRFVALEGALKIKGALPCAQDLNDGDKVIVAIFGPDGQELTRREAQLTAPPTFEPIRLEGATIGYKPIRLEGATLGYNPIRLEGATIGYTRMHTATI
jgi:hypothetical protein